MSTKDKITMKWSDRSRILGMPITFTKYSMSDDRIFCEKGLLSVKFEEILLYRDHSGTAHFWSRQQPAAKLR